MWDGDRKTSYDLYVRGTAVVVAAFIVTGLIFVAGQRAWNSAQQRIGGRFSRVTGDDSYENLPTASTASASKRGTGTSYSPGAPGFGMPRSATGGYSAPPPQLPAMVTAPPPPMVGPFSSAAERQQAREAIGPLREAFGTVRHYDTGSLWQDAPTTSNIASTGNAAATGARAPGEDINTGSQSRITPARPDAAVIRQRLEQKILTETDALAANISLAAHPDRFPEPLRDLAGEMAREARTYLQTVQYAVVHPEEKGRLRPLAEKHLTRSEELLRQLESTAGVNGAGGSLAN